MTELLDGYLDRATLAAQLNVSERTLSRYESERDGLPSLMLGGRRLYRLEAVREWLQRRERMTSPVKRGPKPKPPASGVAT